MVRINIRNILSTVIIATTVLVVSGCSEHDTPVPDDAEEITRYIYETDEGRGLFRTDNLFLDQPFTIPFDTAVYRIIVDSVQRNIELSIFIDTVRFDEVNRFTYQVRHDYGSPFGELWDAEAVVDDRFFIKTLRIIGNDTTFDEQQRVVTRFGYFLKLGDDGNPFFGWKLWGYNGGASGPIQVEVFPQHGEMFRGDNLGYEKFRYAIYIDNYTLGTSDTTFGTSEYAYKRLDQLGTIQDGDILRLQAKEVPNSSWYQTLSAATDSGYQLRMMHRSDSSHYVDTVKTPDNNKDIWNIIFLQETRRFFIPGQVTDTMGTNWFGWCVPFRVEQ